MNAISIATRRRVWLCHGEGRSAGTGADDGVESGRRGYGRWWPSEFATNVTFADDPLVSGMILTLVHLAELRTAVNALRTAVGLAPQSFTGSRALGLAVGAIHFTELRQALNAARSQFGASPVSFEAAFLGMTIYAAHVEQLRGGVR